jgi:ketosteroid isomerase-like protein
MRAILILTFSVACGLAGQARSDDGAEIRRVLDAQVEAWNRKDLIGYMNGYWKSPELTFFGGAAVTRGWQATLDRYKKRYQGEGREMGRLTFADLSIESFGNGAGLARGHWKLTMTNGETHEGLFTVVFRKLAEGWRVVHDHSSGN